MDVDERDEASERTDVSHETPVEEQGSQGSSQEGGVPEVADASYETPVEERSSQSELNASTAPEVGDASHETLYEDPDSDYQEKSEEESGVLDGADSGVVSKEAAPDSEEVDSRLVLEVPL